MEKRQILTILLVALPILSVIIGGTAVVILIDSLQDRPPTIYTPTHSDLYANVSIVIDVKVTDDRLVQSVKLTYTNDSWANSYDISMVNLITVWACSIPGQDNETTVLFEITALDNGGNTARNNNNSNYFYLYIVNSTG